MGVYTAPSVSFIDTYINTAKDRDSRTDARKSQWFDGILSGVKGGVDAYKWQQRKNILDKAGELDRREKEIIEELDKLKGERDREAQSNMSAIMSETNWKGVPFKRSEMAQPGIGIYRKELL